MTKVRASASAVVGALPAVVYEILSDYREGHPSILPARYFTGLEVERGGRGAGTIIRFGMKVAGSTNEARAEVSEPEPGRVLVERVLDEKGIVTSFTVDPHSDGESRVTIDTQWPARGAVGLIERIVVAPMLKRIYVAELAQLDRVARSRASRERD
jgi:hypothetical protein